MNSRAPPPLHAQTKEWSRVDATATLRRSRTPNNSGGERFQLTETSTVRRRPKVTAPTHRDDGAGPDPVIRVRPVSEVESLYRESDMSDDFRRALKPPVSPKPALGLRKVEPPTPTRRVPLPGPENTHSTGIAKFTLKKKTNKKTLKQIPSLFIFRFLT